MMLKGIPVSEGYAISRVLKIEEPKTSVQKKIVSDVEAELKAYEEAIEKTKEVLRKIIEETEKKYGSETAKIFHAHMMIADDIEIKREVIETVTLESCNYAYALDKVVFKYAQIFANMDDAYLKERAKDLLDVAQSLIHHANKQEPFDFSSISGEVIIALNDLAPSQAALINPKHVKGILTEMGGKTSHSAIIARMMGIPSIVGIPDLMETLEDGKNVIMDGFLGHLHLDFSDELEHEIQSKINALSLKVRSLDPYIGRKTLSKDFERYQLHANIGSTKDLDFVLANDAEGIGLYRTEMLFLDHPVMPSLDVQIQAYQTVLDRLYPKEVIIRTLDIGGDKHLSYLPLKKEDNPFLGNRGIRLSQEYRALFNEQLKALILANTKGNLKIMFPMITALEEWFDIQETVASLKKELDIKTPIPLGMMVEVPSAALLADRFAKHVDFFSIGTNDLIQYTLAVDRNNQAIHRLYQPFNPAVLALIHRVAEAGLKHHKEVSVCGEMSSDPYAIPVLLGLGVTQLSMNPSQILKTRRMIAHHDSTYFKNLAKAVLKMDTEQAVIDYLKTHINLEDFHG